VAGFVFYGHDFPWIGCEKLSISGLLLLFFLEIFIFSVNQLHKGVSFHEQTNQRISVSHFVGFCRYFDGRQRSGSLCSRHEEDGAK
jgi:hypothetical protein